MTSLVASGFKVSHGSYKNTKWVCLIGFTLSRLFVSPNMLSLSSRSILKRSFSIYRPAARFYTRYTISLTDLRDRGVMKWNGTRTTHDKDPDVLEVENQHVTSTSVPIPEAPGWKEHLATSSEAHVKVGDP